jgi:hypothetical protein
MRVSVDQIKSGQLRGISVERMKNGGDGVQEKRGEEREKERGGRKRVKTLLCVFSTPSDLPNEEA